MKKYVMRKYLILLFLLLLIGWLAANSQARAISPYTTWALGPGGVPIFTQDAYTPLNEVDLPLSGPEEMYYAPDGFLYVADTGNGRILKLDTELQVVAELGKGLVQSPTGIFVDPSGTLYIADAGKNTIVILDSKGGLVKEFGRPSEPLFGADRDFLPRKIAVDVRKDLYIVSEGSVDGLVR